MVIKFIRQSDKCEVRDFDNLNRLEHTKRRIDRRSISNHTPVYSDICWCEICWCMLYVCVCKCTGLWTFPVITLVCSSYVQSNVLVFY